MTAQNFLHLGIAVLAVSIAAQALRSWLLERRSSKWARLRGRIVEQAPLALLEHYGKPLQPNLDAEFFVEYEIDGHLYRHRAHEISVSFRGITLWRKPLPPEPWVRYNRVDPREHFCEHERGTWRLLMAVDLALTLALLHIAPLLSGKP